MITTKMLYRTFLIFTVLFCCACKKEEVVNASSVVEVKYDGVLTPVTIAPISLLQIYRQAPDSSGYEPVYLGLRVSMKAGNTSTSFLAVQAGQPAKWWDGPYPPYDNNPEKLPYNHSVFMMNQSAPGMGVSKLTNSRFEILSWDRAAYRVSLQFSYTLHNDNDSINVNGRLLNMRYTHHPVDN